MIASMQKRRTLSRGLRVILVVLVAAAAFWAGARYQMFIYDDICLDMGGGRNPGGYPVCVVEVRHLG